MPRIIHSFEKPKFRFPELLAELVNELKSNRKVGQPLIDEEHLPRANTIRITVIWDKWERVPNEERAATIFQAYEKVEGKEFSDRIALAIGVTYPEAIEYGFLPYRVVPRLRPGDPVTPEQCRQAFLDQGASLLLDPDEPQLRFPTKEQAEACVQRLIKQFPGSEPCWGIDKELGAHVPESYD